MELAIRSIFQSEWTFHLQMTVSVTFFTVTFFTVTFTAAQLAGAVEYTDCISAAG